jgi:hypothetical protein
MSARAWTGPSWQLFEIFGDATKSDNDIVDEFIGPILKDALARKQKNEKFDIKLNPEEDTMLNSLLSQTDDYKLLRDETVNILIAGECLFARNTEIFNHDCGFFQDATPYAVECLLYQIS